MRHGRQVIALIIQAKPSVRDPDEVRPKRGLGLLLSRRSIILVVVEIRREKPVLDIVRDYAAFFFGVWVRGVSEPPSDPVSEFFAAALIDSSRRLLMRSAAYLNTDASSSNSSE